MYIYNVTSAFLFFLYFFFYKMFIYNYIYTHYASLPSLLAVGGDPAAGVGGGHPTDWATGGPSFLFIISGNKVN